MNSIKVKSILELGIIATFLMLVFSFVGSTDSPVAEIAYPEGYREWTHIKTSLAGLKNIPQGRFDGYQHIYANDKALAGYKTGVFADGSILVFDMLDVDTTASFDSKGNQLTAGFLHSGKRKFIDVMYRDNKAYKETGGWGFEEFNGDSRFEGRLTPMRQLNCFKSCHQKRSATNFLFSDYNP